MDKVRLVYSQTGRAVWMSHLDAMRTLQRAMLRSEVPIRYSEGFNPHALISILMPLSVGSASLCQMADIRLREDVDLASLPERLNRALPEGLRVLDAYEDAAKPALLKWLRAEGVWEYDTADPAETADRCRALFADRAEVRRRTKRGEGVLVITDHIRELRFAPEKGIVRVDAVVSCAEPVVNPDLLTETVRQNIPDAAPDAGRFCRTALYTADGGSYR